MEYLNDDEGNHLDLEATLFDQTIEQTVRASPYIQIHDTPLLSPQNLTPYTYPQEPFNLDENATLETSLDTQDPAEVHNYTNYNSYNSYHSRGSVGSIGSYTPESNYGSLPNVTTSKISKPSPNPRTNNNNVQLDDEFILGEPAAAIGVPDDDLDDRLRNALIATSKATSHHASRRASTSSNRSTSWILPRRSSQSQAYTSHSAGPSPLIVAEDSKEHRVSKRQIHKLAEQERRNRMNTAISNLASLLDLGPDKSANSKAATVERASTYIRQLQSQVSDLKLEIAHLKQEKSEGNGGV